VLHDREERRAVGVETHDAVEPGIELLGHPPEERTKCVTDQGGHIGSGRSRHVRGVEHVTERVPVTFPVGDEHVGLRGEVAEEGAFGHADVCGDRSSSRRLVALLAEPTVRGDEQALPRRVTSR